MLNQLHSTTPLAGIVYFDEVQFWHQLHPCDPPTGGYFFYKIIMYFFILTPPIKLKLGLQKVRD